MWLIFLIWSFGASTVASLYTPRCSNSGPPVCATNGQEYLYFGNECKLNAYIYQQQFQGKPIPVRTEMENCLFHCYEIVCPSVYKPVCVQQVPAGPITTVAHPCLVNRLICETKQHWKIISEGPCTPDYSFSSATAQDYQTYDLSSAPYDGSAQAQIPTPPSYESQGQDYDVAAIIPLLGNAPSPSWYGVQETDYAVPAPASIYDLNPAPAPYDGSAQTQTSAPVSYASQGQDYKAPDPAPTLYAAPPTSEYGDQGKDYAAPAPASIYDLNPAPAPYDGSAQTQTLAPVSYAAQGQDYEAPDPAPTLYAAPPTSGYGDQSKDYAALAPASIYDLNPAPAPYDGSAQTQTSAPVSYASQGQDYKAPDPAPTLYAAPPTSAYRDQGKDYAAPAPASIYDLNPAPAPYDGSAQTQTLAPVSYAAQGQDYEAPDPAPTLYAAPPTSEYGDQGKDYAAPAPASIYDLNPAPAPYDGSAQTQTLAPVSYASQGQDYKAPDPAPTLYAAPPTSEYGDQGKDYAALAPASIYDCKPAPAPCKASAQNQTPTPVSYAAQGQDYKAPDPAPTLYPAAPTSGYGDQGKNYAVPASASIYDLNPSPAPCDGSAQTQTPALVSYAAKDQDYKAPDPAPILYNTAPRPFSYAGQSQTCTASAAAPLINSVADQSPISLPYSYGVIGQSNEVPAARDQYAAPSPFSYIIPLERAKSAPYSDPNQYQVPAPSHFVVPLPFAAPDKSSYPSLPYFKSPLQPDPVSASYSVPYPFAAPQQASDANMQSTPTPNPYVAPVPDFADYLRGNFGRYPDPVFDNSYSELATALNIARLFRWLRLPFGPIYYRPNYIHIIYNED